MSEKKKLPLIIDEPSLVPMVSRLGWGAITTAFWAIWFYLWLPLITLAAWSFGLYQAHAQFHWDQQVAELKRLLGVYSIVVAALGSILLLWALSEYLRFHNKHRRSSAEPVSPKELSQQCGLSALDIAAWQKLQCVIAYHDDNGGFIGADAVEVPYEASPP
ncbi:hypothetical protein GCM10027343_04720 [Noviherbaspirillum agri]